MWNSSTRDCECDKTCQIGDYLDVKNCAFKERVIDHSVLTPEDEILNRVETTIETATIIDKK